MTGSTASVRTGPVHAVAASVASRVAAGELLDRDPVVGAAGKSGVSAPDEHPAWTSVTRTMRAQLTEVPVAPTMLTS
jgi:hypothetical protein